ncbi:hypothetical protein U1Q18_007849 [Sarracenia purpurea var. burkii]
MGGVPARDPALGLKREGRSIALQIKSPLRSSGPLRTSAVRHKGVTLLVRSGFTARHWSYSTRLKPLTTSMNRDAPILAQESDFDREAPTEAAVEGGVLPMLLQFRGALVLEVRRELVDQRREAFLTLVQRNATMVPPFL